ncbi:hypothetical protein AF335_21845 [Streptomyces eurocidicus]|uniref:Lipoprotein n=1 Tax=Streptomyces eurocidicus TaxID=66423 RepID=A0A2N8NS04_STREU|nr:hypothetical protein [Streptomyces eurocidicus]MBB5122777.1 hypothetical protein [Streptomyces eurocidicus]MBF6051756.1 hypothetical protein [Streptomyces eurocidicus]PNE31532.1 hypothetical protein AF335_21845 [Streptomyces eurocidicus]
MQRRAYAPAAALVAAVLTAGLTSCSGASGAGGGGDDSKPGHPGSSAPAGEPGKYRGLPEPCGYVNRDTLRRLLPAGEDESEAEIEKVYKGQAAITYDTDRRVGCRWRLETPEGTRHLSVDFERVVSYQPGVSDEQRARQLYAREATAAHIPAATSSASSTATPAPSSGSPSTSSGAHPQGGAESGKPSTTASPSPSGPPSGSPAGLAPRALDDLGDEAFVDDKLSTTGSGVHRDIAIVFRSANVLVTIAYDQWSTDRQRVPSSEDLQGRAHALARELDAGHFGN